MLAKASSLGGALLGGGGLGIVGYLLSRSVVASPNAVTMSVVAAAGAILLLVAGLVAEHMCSIPPGDEKRDDGAPDPRGMA